MEVVEEFESRQHEPVFCSDAGKGAEKDPNVQKKPKALPGVSGGQLQVVRKQVGEISVVSWREERRRPLLKRTKWEGKQVLEKRS